MDKTVVELFAGVGGFRVGLNNVTLNNDGTANENGDFNFVWANQWEPSTKTQDAFNCYIKRFGNQDASNEDISSVKKDTIPNHSLLVGGFPCQDYSVARSLSKEKGIEGKKGVLWWQINDILKTKNPPFVLLENVDRLLKSPSKQRGRDFGIMLRCFADLDYSVEWRVINAAEYGHSQRRRRVYIFAYKNKTNYGKQMSKYSSTAVIQENGLFAHQFPILTLEKIHVREYNITKEEFSDLVLVSNKFKASFENSGYMRNGLISTIKNQPKLIEAINLDQIIIPNITDEEFYITSSKNEKFEVMKGSKKILREKEGIQYYYSEGKMAYPDKLDLPGRTMLTSEGTTNRSSHVIEDPVTLRKRLLTPVECERLNEFPDNWTDTMLKRKRYFMMGNALVTGIINSIGCEINTIIDNEK